MATLLDTGRYLTIPEERWDIAKVHVVEVKTDDIGQAVTIGIRQ